MAKKKQGDMQVADRTQPPMQTVNLTKGVSEIDDLLRSVMIREDSEEQAVFKGVRVRCLKE